MKAGKGMYCCCNKKEPTGCATGFKMGKKSRLDLDFSQIKKLALFSARNILVLSTLFQSHISFIKFEEN